MKRLNVAWLHSHFLYWMGGTKFVFEVIKRLSDRLDITVFVEQASPVILAKYDEIGVPVRIIARKSSNDPSYWLMFPLHLRDEIGKLRETLPQFDVLVSSMFPMNHIAAQFKRPLVQYCYEPFAFFHDPVFIRNLPPTKRYLTMLLARMYKHLDVSATRAQDTILTLSDVTQSQIQRVYGRDAITTFEGVDTAFFRPSRDPRIDAKYEGQRVLMHCTDFSPIKGTPLVVRALPHVLERVPATKLLITSTIDDHGGLARLRHQVRSLGVEDKVEYLGFVDFNLLPSYFTRADVLIHAGIGTSGATTMSLPVKEALACETPVIRSPDTQDEVQHGVSGLLVDPRDAQRLAESIVRILEDPDTAQAMGRAGRAYIMKHFTWESVSDKIRGAIIGAVGDEQ